MTETAPIERRKRCYLCRELFCPPSSRVQLCARCAPRCPVCDGPTRRRGSNCTACRHVHRRPGALVDAATPYADDIACQLIVSAYPDGLTLAEVGEAMGFTRERARQIEANAVEQFAKRCALAGITREDVEAMLARRAKTCLREELGGVVRAIGRGVVRVGDRIAGRRM